MSEDVPAFGAADLTNCDREPIHIPGSIQPHGALFALDPRTLRIEHAGGDTQWLLGVAPGDLIGKTAEEWLWPGQIARLRDLMSTEERILRPAHAFRLTVAKGKDADVTAHFSDSFLILEFEPILDESLGDSLALVQTMVRSVQDTGSVDEFCAALARVVRAATGFDRVMVYRFAPDGSGAVVAEERDPALTSFFGQHFPASDIPRQARELYLRNWVRLIPDMRYKPAPLLPAIDPRLGRPLDLSQCALRSVSPIHLEYLGNMGVVASMSLSLIIDGKLWGLVACHHSSGPHHIPHRLRVGLNLFSQMASFLLETKVAADAIIDRNRVKGLYDSVLGQLSHETELTESFDKLRPRLLDLVDAGGVGLWIEGAYLSLGVAPQQAEIAGIVAWLNDRAPEGLFETSALPLHYPPARDFANVASGILALSISREPRDYVIWFRPEIVETVVWAGNPDKADAGEDDGPRLSPRKSFAAWRQERRFQSRPWDQFAIDTVQRLRVALLEVVLRRVDQIARERETDRLRQEALLAALDDRIKQWEATAWQLKVESDRRTVVETELSRVLRNTVVNQESDRQRIARELHDSLGQFLAVMKLDLEAVEKEIGESAGLKLRIAKLKDLTSDVGQEVHRLAWELRPTVLDDVGLQPAIQQFIEEWSQRSGFEFDMQLTLDDRRLPSEIETALYRILQETVTNIVKHSNAKKVGVILKATSNEAIMIVEDNGDGFQLDDPSKGLVPSSRLGLLGMRERLAGVGGVLEIETGPGQGTTLIIHVPLDG